MKKVKTSSWVPVDSEGLKWAYYAPGEQGNRNAHGHVWRRPDGYCEAWSLPNYRYGKTLHTMREAADYLYQSIMHRKG